MCCQPAKPTAELADAASAVHLAHRRAAQPAEAGNFVFAIGDYTGTGRPDLFCVKKTDTGTGSIEVDVLSGASNYQQFILRTGTPLSRLRRATSFSRSATTPAPGDQTCSA